MSKTGRPRKELDWHLLDSLCELDAQLDYCAEKQLIKWAEEPCYKTIKAAREVIERRIKERFKCTFTEYKDKKVEPIRISIRQKQIKMALGGNAALLIWLGKQMLGQRDRDEKPKLETHVDGKAKIVIRWDDEQS